MIEIGGRRIGYGEIPCLSAELSISHQGNLALAEKMIDEAANCGASGVKLQYFRAEDFSQPDGEMITYKQFPQYGLYKTIADCRTQEDMKIIQRRFGAEYSLHNGRQIEGLCGEITESVYDLFSRNEISLDFVKACQKRAKSHGLIFGVTTTSVQGVKEMASIGVDYLKIASDQINEEEMIVEMSNAGLPIIISTGHVKDMRNDIPAFQDSIVLHCVSEYPAKNAKLWGLVHLSKLFHNLTVGYSHHSQGISDAVRATELGAVWIEAHFVLDHTQPGSDAWWSLDPTELSDLVKAVK